MTEQMGSKSNDVKARTADGLRYGNTTLFRITNFELFVKPNKVVMAAGLVAISCCLGYIAYMRASIQKDNMYVAVLEDGSEQVEAKKSKWD
ncbi:small integral membrane protein 8-like [Centruroides sculpturatus]|uniref:small integral membrane protein 8-like n=1 Tax=Centruroides sculpturatus TaxID=218467 RepID=UPI000C6D74B4|nr:small integral membrane protein 8-like [Centruroides sculpturatus]